MTTTRLFLIATLFVPVPAIADDAPAPIRVAIQCDSSGRTRACPTLLRGLLDEEPLLAFAPRSHADVILWVAVAESGSTDFVHLRFTSELPGAPAVFELTQPLDARAADDEQRVLLREALRRGVAPFVVARHPDAVQVAFAPPVGARVAAGASPFDVALTVSGRVHRNPGVVYESGSLLLDLGYTTRDTVIALHAAAGGSRTRVGGVTDEAHAYSGSASFERHVGEGFWLGARAAASEIDGLFFLREQAALATAVWRLFPPDDPRGNQLAFGYQVGARSLESERIVGVRPDGEETIHALVSGGAVRIDRTRLWLALSALAPLDDPSRREVHAATTIEVLLGGHVDIGLGMDAHTLPGDEWSVSGSFYLRLHFDRTNGARDVVAPPPFLSAPSVL